MTVPKKFLQHWEFSERGFGKLEYVVCAPYRA